MGEAAGAVMGGASMGLGALTSAIGQKMQAGQQEEAAKATARQIRWESQIESEALTTTQRRVSAVNITRTAKSGVRMEGSPLEVLAYNAGQAERNISIKARAANLLAQRYRWMAQQAKLAGDVAFWSTLGTGGLGAISATSTSTGGMGLLNATGGAGSQAGSLAAGVGAGA